MRTQREGGCLQVSRRGLTRNQLWTYSLLESWESKFLLLKALCCSVVKSCLTLCNPWTVALQVSLSFSISQSLLKLTSIESVVPSNHLILCHAFSSCPPSFPASGSFPMSWLFAWGSQSTGASASVLPKNIQDWFPLGLTDCISLQSKGLSRVFSNTTVQKLQFFGSQLPYGATLTSIHDYWKKHTVGSILLGKPEQTRQWTSKLFSPETMTPFPWILSALFSSLFPRLVARALPKFYSWECPELEKERRLLHDVAS